MLELYLLVFMSFFVIIDPLGNTAIYMGLSAKHTESQRKTMAIKTTCVAMVILSLFAFFGAGLLGYFGISMAAFKIAGGLLFMRTAFQMVFETDDNALSEAEGKEAKQNQDISVFPMATPLTAGPGSMGLIVMYMGDAKTVMEQTVTVGAMLSVIAMAGLLLYLGGAVTRFFGVTALNVINRVLGVLLCALSIQFILNGIVESGVFAPLNASLQDYIYGGIS